MIIPCWSWIPLQSLAVGLLRGPTRAWTFDVGFCSLHAVRLALALFSHNDETILLRPSRDCRGRLSMQRQHLFSRPSFENSFHLRHPGRRVVWCSPPGSLKTYNSKVVMVTDCTTVAAR
jgi:hypothetical protein